MVIASVGCALPPHRYEQETLVAGLEALWTAHHFNTERVQQLHKAVMVGGRNLALPIEAYQNLGGFGAANRHFVEVGTELGAQAMERALQPLGLGPQDVDALFFATVTGLSTPSLDAHLANRLRMRSDLKRIPIFGLGCAAGAAGVARLYDYLKAWPDQVAVLLSVELCSLTLQKEDFSIPNLIATGLFGDGAAAVVGLGADRGGHGPRVVATRSSFYPDTEDVMGWDIGEQGFKIILSARVPDMVLEHVGHDVDGFLATHGLTRRDIQVWVCHPGGPKVLEAFEQTLGVTRAHLQRTWTSLLEIGNLSSASVLFVLHDTLEGPQPPSGTYGLLLAMGPGFHSELVLLQW